MAEPRAPDLGVARAVYGFFKPANTEAVLMVQHVIQHRSEKGKAGDTGFDINGGKTDPFENLEIVEGPDAKIAFLVQNSEHF